MSMTIRAEIVSQEKEIFSGLVNSITVSGIMGEMGIQYGHAPLLTKLIPGMIKIRKPNGETDYFYISGGMLEVQPHCVTVLSDIAEHGHDLDVDAAMRAKQRAEDLIKNRGDEEDLSTVQAELARAIAQLKVIQELRNIDVV